MFEKKSELWRGESAILLSGVGNIDLTDTFECGQAFRYELIEKSDGYTEYMTVVKNLIVRVGQRSRGELMFFGISENELTETVIPYFALDTDFDMIRKDIVSLTDSDWMKNAAECGKGIVILKQDSWETLFSFIISQNNNIPRIRKIIRALAIAYGENLALKRKLKKCPAAKINESPCEGLCSQCGACYSFPTAQTVAAEPEKMLPSKPGFRYKYLLACAESITSGRIDLADISDRQSYDYTVAELKKIPGVGDKVASCVARTGI